MAKKRFTFADAKLKIKELEEQVEDLQGFIKEEIDRAEEDVIADVRDWGYGDTAIVIAGFLLGLFVGAVFI